MATYEQAEQWLQGFTAMPGWSFDLDRHDSLMRGIVVLIITHDTANADAPDRVEWPEDMKYVTHYRNEPCTPVPVKIGSRSPVPLTVLPDRKSFYQWLWGEIHERLGHELLEWMRVDGQRIFDPHPADGVGRTAYKPYHYLLGERHDERDDSFASARFDR